MRGEEEEGRGETGRSIEEKNHRGEKLGIDQGSKGQRQPGSGGEEMKVVMTGRSRAPRIIPPPRVLQLGPALLLTLPLHTDSHQNTVQPPTSLSPDDLTRK